MLRSSPTGITGAAPAALAPGPVLGLGQGASDPPDGPAATSGPPAPLAATAAAGAGLEAGLATAGAIGTPG